MTDDLIKIADMQHTKSEPNMQTNTNREVIVSYKKIPNFLIPEKIKLFKKKKPIEGFPTKKEKIRDLRKTEKDR